MTDPVNFKEEFHIAYARCLRYLAYRHRSEKEMRDFLQKKETHPEILEACIERLKEDKFLSDDEFVKWWIEQRQTFKKKGHAVIKQELLQKGVDKALIEKHLEESAEDDAVVARELFYKHAPKIAHLPTLEFKQKMSAYLQRRGHRFSVIHELLKEYFKKVKENS